MDGWGEEGVEELMMAFKVHKSAFKRSFKEEKHPHPTVFMLPLMKTINKHKSAVSARRKSAAAHN